MKKVLKYLGIGLLALLAVLLVLGFIYKDKIQRVQRVNQFFDEDRITQNFMGMDQTFPIHWVKKSDTIHTFPKGNAIELPSQIAFEGNEHDTEEFLSHINNSAFLVIQNDSIVYEHYRLGHQQDTRHAAWSVSKSFISALIGIAIEEGKIKDVNEAVTDYVPELKGSGYDGVRIKDVLQMSSGVAFNEDYSDFNSDINRMGRAVAFGSSMDAFAKTLKNEREPGTFNQYVSVDTHVLGMVVRAATGIPIHQYMEEKIWSKIGTESDGYWIKDDADASFVLGGFNATVRDYARFGRLYLNDGNWNGEQLIPADWCKASTNPDGPHLTPGNNPYSTRPCGYGYQWWLPVEPQGDFLASGRNNQAIYVNRKKNMVIAFNSSNPHFGKEGDTSKLMCIQLFQQIAGMF